MERLPIMECIMTPSNGEHLKERKIKERGTPEEKCSLGKMGTGFLLWFTKRPPAQSWWVQKLSADLTAD
jgi:hypothetical protein